ncbi:CD48 antigen-like [Hyla sarda]|uniref:CD48 antigen-like n=1 Tax=Hyla sarda TaxID=327740 RepID=UPI0024C45FCF|nr:CD48 antigen-like [Hyla sarda]
MSLCHQIRRTVRDVCSSVAPRRPCAKNLAEGESKLCEDDIVIKLDGILGEPLVLYTLPSKLENETLLLKHTEGSSRKTLLKYNRKPLNNPKYQFNENNGSVVIHNLQKDDEKKYELLLEKENGEEEFCNIRVKVYERISNLRVTVTEDSLNDTCMVTMNCLMDTGENVTLGWRKDDKNLSHEGSTLEIGITSDNANSTYTCNAKNPVSEQSSNHTLSSACNPDKENSHHGLILYISVWAFTVVLTIIVVTVVLKKQCNEGMYTKRCISHPNGGQSRPSDQVPQGRPPAPNPVSEHTHADINTVYSEVNKTENPVPENPIQSSSVYDLAGPSRDYLRSQNGVPEDNRVSETHFYNE